MGITQRISAEKVHLPSDLRQWPTGDRTKQKTVKQKQISIRMKSLLFVIAFAFLIYVARAAPLDQDDHEDHGHETHDKHEIECIKGAHDEDDHDDATHGESDHEHNAHCHPHDHEDDHHDDDHDEEEHDEEHDHKEHDHESHDSFCHGHDH